VAFMTEVPNEDQMEQEQSQGTQSLQSETRTHEGNSREVVFDIEQIDLSTKKDESQKRLAAHGSVVENRQMGAHLNPRHSCCQPFENLPVDESEEEHQSKAKGKSKKEGEPWCWGWLLSGEDKQDDYEIDKICVHSKMSVVIHSGGLATSKQNHKEHEEHKDFNSIVTISL
jgi:hypothetical protein